MLLSVLHAAAREVHVPVAAPLLLLAVPLAVPPRHPPRHSDLQKLSNAVPNLPHHTMLPVVRLAPRLAPLVPTTCPNCISCAGIIPTLPPPRRSVVSAITLPSCLPPPALAQ